MPNVANSTFEGTARELLRVEHNTRIHPMGDLIFNPDRPARQSGLGRAVHRLRRRRIG